jgi:hypothetical protein
MSVSVLCEGMSVVAEATTPVNVERTVLKTVLDKI